MPEGRATPGNRFDPTQLPQLSPQTAAPAPASAPTTDTAMTVAGVTVGAVVATAAIWAITEIVVTGTWNRIKKRF